ncbi:popeye domain-containing 2 [Anabrus simplex]|uniref:popeye domain-containing 2 n=1 Tax=Anabrus simplex TaxID=316456 RepID=UPI0035A39D03
MKKNMTRSKEVSVELGLKGEMLLAVMVVSVLLVIGDVEVNPGPQSSVIDLHRWKKKQEKINDDDDDDDDNDDDDDDYEDNFFSSTTAEPLASLVLDENNIVMKGAGFGCLGESGERVHRLDELAINKLGSVNPSSEGLPQVVILLRLESGSAPGPKKMPIISSLLIPDPVSGYGTNRIFKMIPTEPGPPGFHFSSTLNSSLLEHEDEINFNYTLGTLPWCDVWRKPQHLLFQLANACFVISYAAPSSAYGVLFMHSALIFGFMLFSFWAWNVICAPDVFSWNFSFMLLNMGQLVYIIYQMRPVKFDLELEEAYQTLFQPFKVSRLVFKKMVSSEFAQIMSLHAGEAYAMQNVTRTDRLGLLLSGKVNVMSDHQFLHPIMPCEFLDSPEFESSRSTTDDKFKVSIIAATSCRYLYWQRSSLEYLFVKETYLATVLTTLIARDITTKLYAMNKKIVTEKGSHLDIRLPSITSSLTSAGEYKSPPRALKQSSLLSTLCPTSPDSVFSSRERLCPKENGVSLPNGRVLEMEPLRELPSNDDLASTNGVESWLETSSKYHSCEVVDN